MGNLPAVRVCEATPFANTGIDFCGPFHIKEKKHRIRGRIKVYCVFVCMLIKAIHFEVVSDLSSDDFFAALRRFVGRRALPTNIYSGNDTNFVEINNQLKELYVLLNSDKHHVLIRRFASERRINWHFISPAAPHFGGLWEFTVKLFKHNFKVKTIVLIKDKNQSCSQWALSKITELYLGEDKIGRIATGKTAVGELRRARRLLYPLPID
ncbi:PREDICTED: uncharacterized protein LOC106746138 [Dinoponera quadriceps]|uniref:Uncharacterized protein LOC106746138 n=1 Tax=Dinoponera quadriceps TaxID=609295 RepID=A0A6P3XHC3_DINQU|nr:PREDICTED: uncharacterized protein LOC106746138 [Dinoponera quadriceps]